MERQNLENATGELFEQLWGQYDRQLFDESVDLFERRLQIHRFDTGWFKGKSCLDAGCGGGRNSLAMARLGASQVHGIDLGKAGLEDARRRAAERGLENVEFKYGSILDIPFEDETFDLVWCAGVLMITANEEQSMSELARVTKHGGYLYTLVYALGGLRWPLVQLLRPLAAQIGKPTIEKAMKASGLRANKCRTFLDDLFCPKLDFYTWERMERLLRKAGFTKHDRWGVEERLDHEGDLVEYRKDFEDFLTLFAAGDNGEFGGEQPLFQCGRAAIAASIDAVQWFENAVAKDELTEKDAMNKVIGQGHHRVLSIKG